MYTQKIQTILPDRSAIRGPTQRSKDQEDAEQSEASGEGRPHSTPAGHSASEAAAHLSL